MSKKPEILAVILSVVSLCLSMSCMFMNFYNDKDNESKQSTQYVMYVGTNDKDTYMPEHSEKEAMEIVDGICLKHFEGYTLQEATGSWTDENNTVTHEYTIVCYFDDAEKDKVYQAADEIIDALNQNTVLIEKNDIQMEYYSGKKR